MAGALITTPAGRNNYGGTTKVTPGPSRHHPVVVAKQAQRAADLQLRIADGITAFAGSMPFVYIHVALFAVWMLFIESRPWPMLTLIVSLEAIFLSTLASGLTSISRFLRAPPVGLGQVGGVARGSGAAGGPGDDVAAGG